MTEKWTDKQKDAIYTSGKSLMNGLPEHYGRNAGFIQGLDVVDA